MKVKVISTPWYSIQIGEIYDVVAMSNNNWKVHCWYQANRIEIKTKSWSSFYPEKYHFSPIFDEVKVWDTVSYMNNKIGIVTSVSYSWDDQFWVIVKIDHSVSEFWEMWEFRILERLFTRSVTKNSDMTIQSKLSRRLNDDYLTAKKEKEILNKAKKIKSMIEELDLERTQLEGKAQELSHKIAVLQETYDAIEEEFESPDPEEMEKLLSLDISLLAVIS